MRGIFAFPTAALNYWADARPINAHPATLRSGLPRFRELTTIGRP